MIDTLSLVGTLDSLRSEQFRPEMLRGPWTRLSRQSATGGWESAHRCTVNGITITVCLTTGQVDIRFSVPRLVHSHGVNYPLVPFSEVDLGRLARTVAYALGCPERRLGDFTEWLSGALQHEFGVRAVAFAVDVVCFDIEGVLSALSKVRLRQPSQTWARKVPTGVQWHGSTRRLMLYDKASELVSRPRLMRARDEAGRRICRELSKHAKRRLRVEVTFIGATSVRLLAGLDGGHLPTLTWIANSEIGAYALTREAERLGLLEVVDLSFIPGEAPCSVALAVCCGDGRNEPCAEQPTLASVLPSASGNPSQLARLIARLSENVPGGRAKTSAKGNRILQAVAFALIAPTMSKEAMISDLRFSGSTLWDNVGFLRKLGLGSLQSTGLEGLEALRAFAEAFLSELGGPVICARQPRPVAEGSLPSEVVIAPWGDPPEYDPEIDDGILDEVEDEDEDEDEFSLLEERV